jgi:hypothetical protein
MQKVLVAANEFRQGLIPPVDKLGLFHFGFKSDRRRKFPPGTGERLFIETFVSG